MAGNDRDKYSIEEYKEKASAALNKLRNEQKPGQNSVGTKTDILHAMKDEIKKLMDDGYTAKQIAEALSSHVFNVTQRSVTQIAGTAPRKKIKRPTRAAGKEQQQDGDKKPIPGGGDKSATFHVKQDSAEL